MCCKLHICVLSLFLIQTALFAQDENLYDSLQTEKVLVENPVYKPIIGLGAGVLNFYGEVTDNFQTAVSGPMAPKVTISTHLNETRQLELEFFLIRGVLSGNQSKSSQPLNFRTDITDFGIALHYNLRHINFKNRALSPFVGIGIETFQFNSKGDLRDSNGEPYQYEPDGTILDNEGKITSRDYTYESDLRDLDRHGYGKYSQAGFGIPVDLGVDLALSKRVNLRFGTSFHFSFSDYIDDVVTDDIGLFGNKGNDGFIYSYLTLHLDLFSEPETIIRYTFFAEMEHDSTLFEDEDGDSVLDFFDNCPGTPFGVKVDSLGCPFDSDLDGVPDYRDQELNSSPGAYVDEMGIELAEEKLISLLTRSEAVRRDEIDYYLNREIRFSRFYRRSGLGIPMKFENFDSDENDYISFDELLYAIGAFFDFRTFLSKEDMYELINFFFIQ